MDLRASSKFRQTTTGAQLRRRREGGTGLDDRYNTKTFSRQLNHYQTQVTKIYSLLPDLHIDVYFPPEPVFSLLTDGLK